MHLVGYLVLTIAKVLQFLINIYTFIVAVAVIINWVHPDPFNPIVALLRQATEPTFRLARRLLPKTLYRTGIDFSPIIVFIFLIVIETFVVGWLADLAGSFLRR